jgi:hypothetical protein
MSFGKSGARKYFFQLCLQLMPPSGRTIGEIFGLGLGVGLAFAGVVCVLIALTKVDFFNFISRSQTPIRRITCLGDGE